MKSDSLNQFDENNFNK